MNIGPPPVKVPASMLRGSEVIAYLEAQKDALYQTWRAVGSVGGILVTSDPPATSDAPGVEGTITWGDGYIYVCTATDTWQRAALSTW